MLPTNLLSVNPLATNIEQFNTLLTHSGVTLERIVSPARYQSEPYLKTHDEWVMVLQGKATLRLVDQRVQLVTGDCLMIPAHTPHQVEITSASPPCVWLALHLPEKNNQ